MTSYTVLILLLFYQHTMVFLMRDSTVLRRNGLNHSSKFVVPSPGIEVPCENELPK